MTRRPGAGAAFSASDWAVFSAIGLIWGASFLFIAVGLEALEPGVVTLVRVSLGALTLRLLPGSRTRLQPEDRVRMVVVAIVWVAIPFTLFPLAEQHINSAIAGLLNGAVPTFAAIFGLALHGQRTSGPQLAGLALGVVGVALISAPSLGEGSSQAAGVLMVLGATLCYGLSVHLAAPLQARYGALPVTARMLAIATLCTAPFGLFGLAGSEAALGPIAAVVVLGVLGTGIAYLLMATLIGRVGATRASFITYLIPVVSLVLGVVFRDDHVAAVAVAGCALVIAGAVLAGRADPAHRRELAASQMIPTT